MKAAVRRFGRIARRLLAPIAAAVTLAMCAPSLGAEKTGPLARIWIAGIRQIKRVQRTGVVAAVVVVVAVIAAVPAHAITAAWVKTAICAKTTAWVTGACMTTSRRQSLAEAASIGAVAQGRGYQYQSPGGSRAVQIYEIVDCAQHSGRDPQPRRPSCPCF